VSPGEGGRAWVGGQDVRRAGSCCRPAFMVAAACRETEARGEEAGGDSPLWELDMLREEKGAGVEGGSELRSGDMSWVQAG